MEGKIKKTKSIKSSYVAAIVMVLSTVMWIGSGIVDGEMKAKKVDQSEMKTEQLLPFVRVMESIAQIQNQNFRLRSTLCMCILPYLL